MYFKISSSEFPHYYYLGILFFLMTKIPHYLSDGCFFCDGEHECSGPLDANHTVEACPGLGTTHVCKVEKCVIKNNRLCGGVII